ncbi:MAG: hypothetical protein GF320_16565 [Armatimonadia bacterium]|nr:hypothetical protein [Armatimonadia bacterium]
MRIIRPVQIRFVVTEDLKERLLAESKQAQQSLDSRIQHIDVEGRRVVDRIQRENVLQAGQVREQIEQEKQQLMQLRREMNNRMEELQKLDLGEEIAHRTEDPVQEVIDIAEGDSIAHVLGGSQIVIKDDKVVEIREASAEGPEAIDEALGSSTIATPDNPIPEQG